MADVAADVVVSVTEADVVAPSVVVVVAVEEADEVVSVVVDEVDSEVETVEEEEGLDEKMLHLTAKLERQFAETAKLEGMIRENLRGWSYGN